MGTGSGAGLNFGGTKGSLPEIIKEEDWHVYKSLGAAALNYDVFDSKGRSYRFIGNSTISNVETFAGKGVRKKLRPEVSLGLSGQYGGRPKDWKHCKGTGYLDFHGRARQAEVHWFEESKVGKVKFKIKKWLE